MRDARGGESHHRDDRKEQGLPSGVVEGTPRQSLDPVDHVLTMLDRCQGVRQLRARGQTAGQSRDSQHPIEAVESGV